MTGSEHELRRARAAAAELSRAVNALGRAHGADLDVRRLVQDAHRIEEDLALLAGPQPAGSQETVVITDEDYPPEFWADADDEGIGRR